MQSDLYDRYQGLIFDMDGTLIDTMPAHLEAWQQTAKQFGFPFDQAWLHSMGGMPSFKIATEINRTYQLQLDEQQVSLFKMNAFIDQDNHGSHKVQTTAVLEFYLGKKKLAVGTGSQRESALRLLKENQLLDKLDAVVTATDVENHKPNPDTFLAAARLLQLQPEHCLVFEDTPLGLQAAHAAGMDCMMVEGDELVFYPKP
ncbi:beta-phosphoglucomutase family hydrolase [Vibrio sp.]|uniref:beta-phosphoglucomutase family hydrolase n=1 Tax=Vibrio sp. TaxID=678 RepID=UPI003D1226CF